MSKAFRCDGCGEYHDGAPTTRLGEYKSWVMKESGYEKVAELCPVCSDQFFTLFTGGDDPDTGDFGDDAEGDAQVYAALPEGDGE